MGLRGTGVLSPARDGAILHRYSLGASNENSFESSFHRPNLGSGEHFIFLETSIVARALDS